MTTDDGSKSVRPTYVNRKRVIRKRFENIESLSLLDKYIYLLIKMQARQGTTMDEYQEWTAIRAVTSWEQRVERLGEYDMTDRRVIRETIEAEPHRQVAKPRSTGQPGTPPEEG
jgi:hypothetical protein